MSSGERTEEATPRRLEKARERGEVSQSRDLTGAALLAAAAGVLANQVDAATTTFSALGRMAFEAAGSRELSGQVLLTMFGTAVLEGGKCLLPLFGTLFVLAVFIPHLQVGPLLSFGPITPKFSKLNPISGVKRMLFSLPAYVELLKSALKITVVAVIFWQVINGQIRNILMLSTQPPSVSAQEALSVGGRALTRTAIFFLFIAGLDAIYQRWQYRKGLRMTKEEVKQEYKEQEGDPEHKAHRKRLHEEISSESMLNQARRANAVVTNPEHLACAIRYDPDQEDAPRLLAKGKSFMAQRIREIAKEEDIQIVRDVSLAHALYALELDTQVPEELFDAVAEVLKWVEAVLKAQGETAPWNKPAEPKGEGVEDEDQAS
jgi:flagellar biosynthetic protein FlhB